MSQKAKTKIKLPVLQKNIIEGETCFSIQRKHNVSCERTKCFHWIENTPNCNCVLIAAQNGPKTLQEIGDMFALSRMRICQIEKGILQKLEIND